MNLFFKRAQFATTIAFLLVGLSACGEPVEKLLIEEDAAETKAEDTAVVDVSELIDLAQARHDEAMKLSHGWTRTQPLIDKANAELAAGHETVAHSLAERALIQASASVEQAQLEVSAWKARVPK